MKEIKRIKVGVIGYICRVCNVRCKKYIGINCNNFQFERFVLFHK